jgi:hypothetical protein
VAGCHLVTPHALLSAALQPLASLLCRPLSAPPSCLHLFQTSFFFGYMSLVCYAFFLLLGSVGFRASFTFVRHIYK